MGGKGRRKRINLTRNIFEHRWSPRIVLLQKSYLSLMCRRRLWEEDSIVSSIFSPSTPWKRQAQPEIFIVLDVLKNLMTVASELSCERCCIIIYITATGTFHTLIYLYQQARVWSTGAAGGTSSSTINIRLQYSLTVRKRREFVKRYHSASKPLFSS